MHCEFNMMKAILIYQLSSRSIPKPVTAFGIDCVDICHLYAGLLNWSEG